MKVLFVSYMGGLWECYIQIVRSVMFGILQKNGVQLDDEFFRIFLCKCEVIVNSRSLIVNIFSNFEFYRFFDIKLFFNYEIKGYFFILRCFLVIRFVFKEVVEKGLIFSKLILVLLKERVLFKFLKVFKMEQFKKKVVCWGYSYC